MIYQELREYLLKSKKYPGCKTFSRAPLIHEGFPGTFNLSMTEYDMLRIFGDFSSYDKDLIFSTIQSCVRPQDLFENITNGKNLWKYLGVFEMATPYGEIILSKKNITEKVHVQQIKELIKILTDLGLEKERIFPSYCAGGSISEITQGKYNFNFVVLEDKLTKDTFIKEGIPQKNLTPDKTRDTFLSLHINQKTPWGYRTEINYNIGTNKKPIFVDIATLEYCLWFPIYSGEEVSKNIIGLKESPYTISVGGIGVERLCMVINNLKSVQEIDCIKPFYEVFRKISAYIPEENRIKAGEALRTLHRIFSDVKSFGIKFARQRKQKMNMIIQMIEDNAEDILTKEKLRLLFFINAKLQPWHNNLENGIEFTISEILSHYNSPQQSRERFKRLKTQILREMPEAEEKVRNIPDIASFLPKAEYYEGTEGLKKVADEILKEKDTPVDVIFSSELIKFVPEYNKYFREKRIERKIYLRALVDKSDEIHRIKSNDEEEFRKIKFLGGATENLDSAIYIFGNKIAIITATKKERGGIIIENKELAKIQRKIFEKLWVEAKEDYLRAIPKAKEFKLK